MDEIERKLIDALADAGAVYAERWKRFNPGEKPNLSMRQLLTAWQDLCDHRAAHAPKAAPGKVAAGDLCQVLLTELDQKFPAKVRDVSADGRVEVEFIYLGRRFSSTFSPDEIEPAASEAPKPPECRPPAEHEGEEFMRSKEWWLAKAASEPDVPISAGVYESAVRGRQEFRDAYRSARAENKKLNEQLQIWLNAYADMCAERDALLEKAESVARPSPEIEFDREEVMEKFHGLCGGFSSRTHEAVELVEWALAALKPSPPGEQVDPTDEAIEAFARSYDVQTWSRQTLLTGFYKAALTHFRSPARTVSDEQIIALVREVYAQRSPADRTPEDIYYMTIGDLNRFARELMGVNP